METARPGHFLGGLRYEIHKTVTESDVHRWALLTGAHEAAPLLPAFAHMQARHGRAVQTGYLAGLLVEAASTLVARAPEPGTTLVRLSLELLTPVPVGSALLVRATLAGWDPGPRLYWIDLGAIRADGQAAITGVATMRPSAPPFGPL